MNRHVQVFELDVGSLDCGARRLVSNRPKLRRHILVVRAVKREGKAAEGASVNNEALPEYLDIGHVPVFSSELAVYCGGDYKVSGA